MIAAIGKAFNSERFDKFGRGIFIAIALVFFGLAASLYIHTLKEYSLLTSNDPVKLYVNAASLESTQQPQLQQMIYVKAARLAKEKINLQPEKSILMEYVEAKSSYHLGLLFFDEKQYSKAIDNLVLAVSKYWATNEFYALKEQQIKMKDEFDEINRINEEFDREEVFQSRYLMGRSHYHLWLEKQGLRGREATSSEQEISLRKAINFYRQVLEDSSGNRYYERGSVWFDLGKAYQNDGNLTKARKALLAAYFNDNGDAVKTLKELDMMNEDGDLTIPEEELRQAYLGEDGSGKNSLEVYDDKDSRKATGGIPSDSGLVFLEKHYSEMQAVVKVDDIKTLTNFYDSRYHADFKGNSNFDSFKKFWIDDTSEIVDFDILPLNEPKAEFKVVICLIDNGSQKTLTSTLSLVWGGLNWLIGQAKPEFQDGCNLN
jgi:hypothetical protein